MLPQVGNLPWWCTGLTAAVLLWRGTLAVQARTLPGRWGRTALLAVTLIATFATHRTLLGRDAGVTLVIVLLALKTLELRARRDAFVIFFLSFFAMLTNFFYSQSLMTALTMLVALLGLLLAQYTLTGFDASAHMTEETHNAAVTGPRGIVNSILVSIVAGWVLLIGLTYAIQSYDGAIGTKTLVPPAQIFIDAVGATGGKLLLLIAIGAQLFCGMASVTANSRMIYAFSRDGALPAADKWHRINPRTRTPTNAIWLAAGGAFILGLPYLFNATAYAAVTSIAVIGLYIAYVLPTFLRLRQGDAFERGPWHLGRWSRPIGIVAIGWVAFITVLFMLPTASPVTRLTFNYTPVAVLAVLGFAGIWWIVSARHWFTGPKMQGSAEELAAIELELERLA